jgi:hypothetical protein
LEKCQQEAEKRKEEFSKQAEAGVGQKPLKEMDGI